MCIKLARFSRVSLTNIKHMYMRHCFFFLLRLSILSSWKKFHDDRISIAKAHKFFIQITVTNDLPNRHYVSIYVNLEQISIEQLQPRTEVIGELKTTAFLSIACWLLDFIILRPTTKKVARIATDLIYRRPCPRLAIQFI